MKNSMIDWISHQYINCEICGTKQLKRNFKLLLHTHEKVVSKERIDRSFEGCDLTFANGSNLRQHVKAVQLQERSFVCSFDGCGMRLSFKYVRDNHQKSSRHYYTLGDFVEAGEEFQSRERVGLKSNLSAMIDSIMRKRVLPTSKSDGIMAPTASLGYSQLVMKIN